MVGLMVGWTQAPSPPPPCVMGTSARACLVRPGCFSNAVGPWHAVPGGLVTSGLVAAFLGRRHSMGQRWHSTVDPVCSPCAGARCIDCAAPVDVYKVQAAVFDDQVCECNRCG